MARDFCHFCYVLRQKTGYFSFFVAKRVTFSAVFSSPAKTTKLTQSLLTKVLGFRPVSCYSLYYGFPFTKDIADVYQISSTLTGYMKN